MSGFDVKAAREALREHFATVTDEEFIENLREWAPEMLDEYDAAHGTMTANGTVPVNGTTKTNDDVPRESVE